MKEKKSTFNNESVTIKECDVVNEIFPSLTRDVKFETVTLSIENKSFWMGPHTTRI